MSDAKKTKYLTKSSRFGTQTITLYSIDGVTWSTRKEELQAIIDRHEAERVTFGEIRGQLSGNKPIVPKEKGKFGKKPFPQPGAMNGTAEKGKKGAQKGPYLHPAEAAKTAIAAKQQPIKAPKVEKPAKVAAKVGRPAKVKPPVKPKKQLPAPGAVTPKKRSSMKPAAASKTKGKKKVAA